MPKLLAFVQIKDVYETVLCTGKLDKEPNMSDCSSEHMYPGIHLASETGRFSQTTEEKRLIGLSELGDVNNEINLLLYFPFYGEMQHLRKVLFDELLIKKSDMFWFFYNEKIKILFDLNVFKLSLFVKPGEGS